MFKSKLSMAVTVLGTALAVLTPAVASAGERDNYRRDDRYRRELRDRYRYDREQRRDRFDRERPRAGSYYSRPQGYNDRYGSWRSH